MYYIINKVLFNKNNELDENKITIECLEMYNKLVDAIEFVNNLKLFGHGYSWGGFESLALHQELREQGNRSYLKLEKNEHLVRLHIGLEDPSDLIADIKQSLKHIK